MIVLDTHALVWWANGDDALSKKAKTTIERELNDGQIVVSAISAWEIAMLVEREKLVLSMDVASWLTTVSAIDAVRFVPVDVEIGLKSVDLPGKFHQDPADRMIVATARKLAVPLVTRDEKIRAYKHVKTVW
ncbi:MULTISPECIES: type II toxin-antitoxin system VapC family toxin [Burkholderiaceae]|uniref:type II toxin-antitoxin system VapC family toxin n=1 Tax=Burkholderiaceae TaxID=119060 RepID=UPI00095C610B|nr:MULTISPECIES: type II toxin-antitoxin system VapC family toxin [unclassified Burkholderia]MCF2134102.1 type II toxin-antitoxin system VapC family toxin [Mycetohabitans sp. B3]MCG1018877.1 type II toxin-antitoxin system VapC family toxin [Mycetohabitans sp. B4]MCG1039654.1 type II toxin-antitoxin system VapC family toxin [Mycetohabitans sp. B7]SIT70350.1 PIN domain nuclease, a component of toxin-antitoxin system (PIN domain) [Burkholderia sp. b14]SIT74440.1 PIN domain nuclease, a component o